MLRFLDVEQQEEVLLAGYKPLPKARMIRQAAREANDFYTGKGYGPFRRKDNRNARKIATTQRTLQKLMATDPDLRRMYVEQIQQGNEPKDGDKFELRRGSFDQNDIILEYRPVDMNVYNTGGPKRSKGGLRWRDDKDRKLNRAPEEVKTRLINNIKEVERFINEDYDPIGAVEKEAQNRKRGGNKPLVNGPDVDSAAAVELIQPIAPLDGEIRPAGMIPGV